MLVAQPGAGRIEIAKVAKLKTSRSLRICLFFLWTTCTAWAVDPYKQISQYGHTAWRIQDGFFSGAPNAIAQTRDGYLWIGTENGLIRFDGVHFVPWVPLKGKLLSSGIFSLLAGTDGSLWIGTSTNLAHLQNGNLTNYLGSGFAQFLFGISDYNGLSSSILSNNWRDTGSLYVQDDWKVSPSLTVNAGLRWEFGTGLHEAQNRVAGIDLSNGNFMLPKSRQGKSPMLPAGIPVEYVDSDTLMDMHQLNFGPRLGLSYKLGAKTVVRAGAGIFYANPFPAGVLDYPLNPPFGVAVQGPNVIDIDTGFSSTYLSNFNVQSTAIDIYQAKPNYPTTNNWNVAVQWELPGAMTFEAAYVGSTSTHVNAGRDMNQPYPSATNTPPATRRPYPNLGILGDVLNSSNGNYHSLQTKLEKRSRNITYLLAYTLGHSLDDAPSNITLSEGENWDFYRDPRNPKGDYGNSYFDIRNRIVFDGLYALPVGRGSALGGNMAGWANQAIGGWQLGGIVQFQTGQHFAAITYTDPSNADIYSFAGAAFPNVTGNVSDYTGCPNGKRSIYCWFNPNAFAPSNPGRYGTEARNSLVGPNDFDMDAVLIKSFPIKERYRIRFRAEAYNASNHPNFAVPNNVVGPGFSSGGNFGQITGVGSQRQVQLALRFED